MFSDDLYKPTRSRFDKRDMGSLTKCLRYGTIIFTVIIFLAGAGLLGLGIYSLASEYGAKQFSEVLGTQLYLVSSYVLLVSGVCLILMSFCGGCGAIRNSRCLLGIFIFFVSVMVIALIVAAIIVFVFRDRMSNTVINSMEDILLQQYGEADTQDNKVVTNMWDLMQRELHCCGVTGDMNSTTSWALYRYSKWYKKHESGKPYVPQSCCKPDGSTNICTGIEDFNGPPSKKPPVDNTMQINPHLYTRGCYDEIVHYIQDHAVLIGACAIIVVVALLFGLGFSVFFCRKADMNKYY
ncbi:hypothetical protein CHS0354_015026 [Potamilus streckersoni]|uniref:Tetraspanin n=1 Tax=Potamilus streckersoni TaxID=2493646 RepID=A0AAE0T2G7_9BIVA|nr:hypothetical protein CHS0354_015026 [Potamilus streckersoni]